jgi:hypothetical protein
MPELSIETAFSLESEPDILIVDTFPRGLLGELAPILPSLKAFKILVHRDLNPEYVRWANLREFVAANYDCILCPGEKGPLADLPQARFTEPWIVSDPVPVEPGASVVICAGGNADELSWYGEVSALLAEEVNVRCLAAELPPGCPSGLWVRHWPSIDWIASAQVVVGGAGYNTVNECAAVGVPLIARTWPRKYDRQRLRAERASHVTIVDTPMQAVAAVTATLRGRRSPSTSTMPLHRRANLARW